MPCSDAFVGIDVSKTELVIHLHPDGRGWRVPNSRAGLAGLGRELKGIAKARTLRIGFEASGGYERGLGKLCSARGLTAFLLDPAQVRSFARAERLIAKTDPIDAALIARCLAGVGTDLTPYVHDPRAQRLAEHVRARDAVVALRLQLGNQLEILADPALRRLLESQLAKLKATQLRIEALIRQVITACPTLAARDTLLRSAPGVGPIVAATLLARMPELGRISSRQVASLAGIAPFDRQSGSTARPGKCQGGRPAVRRALYLAALSAVRSRKGPLAQTYQRLIAAGKPTKLALVATMRKLLVILNAMAKQNQPFACA